MFKLFVDSIERVSGYRWRYGMIRASQDIYLVVGSL